MIKVAELRSDLGFKVRSPAINATEIIPFHI